MMYTPPRFDATLNMHNRKKKLDVKSANRLEPFFEVTAFSANPTSGWDTRHHGFVFAHLDRLADVIFYRAMVDTRKEPDAASRYEAICQGKVVARGCVMGYPIDIRMTSSYSYEMVVYVAAGTTITLRHRPDTETGGRYSLSFATKEPQVVSNSMARFLWKFAGIVFGGNKYRFDRLVRTRTFTLYPATGFKPSQKFGEMFYNVVEQPDSAPQANVVSSYGAPAPTFTIDKSKNKQLKEYQQAATAILDTFAALTDLKIARPGTMLWGFRNVPRILMDKPLKGMSLEDFCQTISDALMAEVFGTICLPTNVQLKHMIRIAIDGYEED